MSTAQSDTTSKTDSLRIPSILVVDDEPEIRALMREYFRMKLKANVVASDGLDSARVVLDDGFAPDLAIIDFNLRGRHTSIDLCRIIQKRLPNCHIIIISAAAKAADKEIPKDLHLENTLQKPFSFKTLLTKVQSILSNAPAESIGFTLYPHPGPENLETLYRLLEQCPDDTSVRHLLAFTLYTDQRYKEAEMQYTTVIKQGLNTFLCHYYFGHVLVRLRKYEKAIEAWERAYALAATGGSKAKVNKRLVQGKKLLKMERTMSESGVQDTLDMAK